MWNEDRSSLLGLQRRNYDNEIVVYVFSDRQNRIWFRATEIINFLKLGNDAIERYVSEENRLIGDAVPRRIWREHRFVNINGIYQLMEHTTASPNMDKFRRWLTADMAPSVRRNRHGGGLLHILYIMIIFAVSVCIMTISLISQLVYKLLLRTTNSLLAITYCLRNSRRENVFYIYHDNMQNGLHKYTLMKCKKKSFRSLLLVAMAPFHVTNSPKTFITFDTLKETYAQQQQQQQHNLSNILVCNLMPHEIKEKLK